jgi:nicotinamide mononucleotide transporter
MNYRNISRLWGNRAEHIEQLRVALIMFVVTAIYEYVSIQFVPGYSLNVYEFLGTWSGLVCVWLSRTTNILCWPWGIFSSVMLGVFFSQIGLPGQQWLNWGYFLIIQLWAWPHWAFGGVGKTDLPISTLSWKSRLLGLVVLIAGTIGIYYLIDIFVPGSFHPWLDATVVASSIIAQYLLGQKKVESWILWLGPVNMLSIVLFYLAGAYTLMALYVAYFIHAIFALGTWAKHNE